MLADTIAKTQGAFVARRQILDVVLVANKIVEEYWKLGRTGVVFKIDFEKAYDFWILFFKRKDLVRYGGNGS